MVADFEEHKAVKFDLKKEEITARAYNEVKTLCKKNEFISVTLVEPLLAELNFLRKRIAEIDCPNWIYISETMSKTGKKAKWFYDLIEENKIRHIGSKYKLKVNIIEVYDYIERKE